MGILCATMLAGCEKKKKSEEGQGSAQPIPAVGNGGQVSTPTPHKAPDPYALREKFKSADPISCSIWEFQDLLDHRHSGNELRDQEEGQAILKQFADRRYVIKARVTGVTAGHICLIDPDGDESEHNMPQQLFIPYEGRWTELAYQLSPGQTLLIEGRRTEGYRCVSFEADKITVEK